MRIAREAAAMSTMTAASSPTCLTDFGQCSVDSRVQIPSQKEQEEGEGQEEVDTIHVEPFQEH